MDCFVSGDLMDGMVFSVSVAWVFWVKSDHNLFALNFSIFSIRFRKIPVFIKNRQKNLKCIKLQLNFDFRCVRLIQKS